MDEESEILAIAASLDAQVSNVVVLSLADKLRAYRETSGEWGCLHRGGAGVEPWIKNRLHEMNLLPPCGGLSEDMGIRVTVDLHFYPWDVEKYGEFLDTPATKFEQLCSGVQRSPLSRLVDADPINVTASRVSQQFGDVCPYCRQTFRNPNALTLHVKERHKDEFTNKRAQR
jgi:hypothetical protein